MNRKSILMRFSSTMLLLLIILGIIELYVASLMVQSRFWCGTLPGGGVWDAWGISVAPAFFINRDFALSILLVASILFLIHNWFEVFVLDKPHSGQLDRYILAGLLLPSLVIYGDPGGTFYNIAPIDFTLTAILSPIYNFSFTGIWEVGSNIMINGVSYYLMLLGVLQLVLGVSQVIALKYYEQNKIGRIVFLIPIFANLLFCFLFASTNLASVLIPSADYAKLSIPIPILTFGVIIRGFYRKTQDQLQLQ